jgi:hypothetical protein
VPGPEFLHFQDRAGFLKRRDEIEAGIVDLASECAQTAQSYDANPAAAGRR